MKRTTAILLTIVLMGAGIALYMLSSGNDHSGYIETTGVVELKEVELAPERGGRIVWLCCEEGDSIGKAEVAIRLDERKIRARLRKLKWRMEQLGIEVEAARQELEAARSIEESFRAAIKGADEEIARAEALLKEAQMDLVRIESLYKDGIATEKELDSARTRLEVLKKDVAVLERRKERLRSERLAKLKELKAQQLRIGALKTTLKELHAQKELLKAELSELTIRSPIAGTVVYKAFEVGEVVPPATPVYTVHDRSRLWVRVDIEETLIDRIKVGTAATVTLPARPEEGFAAEVSEISPLAGFATQRDVKRGRPDIKTFRVKLSIKDGSRTELLKEGMTVNVRITP